MSSIASACKSISAAVRVSSLTGLYGYEGSVNIQGEEVKKLDILSHQHFVNSITASRQGIYPTYLHI